MAKNDILGKFESALLILLDSYTKENDLISNILCDEIKKFYHSFKALASQNITKYETFKEKLLARKAKENVEYKQILTNLENKYFVRKERISKVNNTHIAKLNSNINELQKKISDDNLNISAKYSKKITSIKENFSIIDEASKLNLIEYNKNLEQVDKDYCDFLDQKRAETDRNIKKIHSYYSKQILLANEEENPKILDISNQISELEIKIKTILEESLIKINEIKLKIANENKKFNDFLRDRKKTIDLDINRNKENNIIKQKDIQKILNTHEDEYNANIDKILKDFFAQIKELDIIKANTDQDYKNNIERIKRNYLYNYYYLNFALNDYLKTIDSNVSDSFKLRLANKRLIKLKTRSYYQRIAELKANYNDELAVLNNNYAQAIKRNQLARIIAEINKDYDLAVTRIEANTNRDNFQLFASYIDTQIHLTIDTIEKKYNFEAKKHKAKTNETIEKNNNLINQIDLQTNMELNEAKNQINNLLVLKEKLQQEIKINESFLNTSSFNLEKLEQIISNLELDRSAKIKEYNTKHLKTKESIVQSYANLEKERLNVEIEHLENLLKIDKKIISIEFQKNHLPLISEIDLINSKQKSQISYEDIHFIKNKGLALLDHNRKNYRFDTYLILRNGIFIFDILELLTKFYNQTYSAILPKLKGNNKSYFTFFKNFSPLVFNLYIDILKDFNTKETVVVEERIYNETRNTYKDTANTLLKDFNNEKYLLDKKLENIKNTIALYNNTYNKYDASSKEISNLCNQLDDNVGVVDNIKDKTIKNNILRKRKKLEKLSKEIEADIEKLSIKYSRDSKINDKKLKLEYASSYALVNKANNLLKRVTINFATLEQTYLNPQQPQKLYSSTLFTKIDRIINDIRNTYLDFFNDFKKANETKYQNSQKQIIKTFDQTLKTSYTQGQNKLSFINNKKSKTNKAIIFHLNKAKAMRDLQIKEYEQTIIALENKYKQEIATKNHMINDLKQQYTSNLYSISNNISFLRNDFIKQSKKAKNDYNSKIKKINSTYKIQVKQNNLKLKNSQNRINNDLNNLPFSLNQNIAEIKSNLRTEKRLYDKACANNNHKKRKIKIAYQKDRVSNITNSTIRMLKEKDKQSLKLKKLKNADSKPSFFKRHFKIKHPMKNEN